MKPAILLLLLAVTSICYSQNDFVVLQKRDMNIMRFYTGAPISFYTNEMVPIQGWVSKCIHDSIYVRIGYMGLVARGFGTTIDTIITAKGGFALSEIKLIAKKRLSAADVGNTIVKLVLLGVSVVAVNNLNIEPPTSYLVDFAAGIGISFGISALNIFPRRPTGYHIGKKYKLVFIHISNDH
ncbi:hypothetical protein ACI6Q2_03735 [Chitinophagaceae bacterium LWZ2-11]